MFSGLSAACSVAVPETMLADPFFLLPCQLELLLLMASDLLQVAEETGGMLRRTRGFEELAWEVERCAVDEIGRGAVGVLSPGRADAQHDHGQLVHPVGAGEAGLEGALQLPV